MFQEKPVKLATTFCDKAKDVCCNVDVWGILINIILQVQLIVLIKSSRLLSLSLLSYGPSPTKE
jgi:hypothetical protein